MKSVTDNESCLAVRWMYPRGLPTPVVVDGAVAVRTSRPRRALAVLNKDTAHSEPLGTLERDEARHALQRNSRSADGREGSSRSGRERTSDRPPDDGGQYV